jgi:hypothetical protein
VYNLDSMPQKDSIVREREREENTQNKKMEWLLKD